MAKRPREYDDAAVEAAARKLMIAMGVDLRAVAETPQRVAKAWKELLGGYDIDPPELLKTKFDDDALGNYDQAVCLRGIEFVSTCEHHLMPFEGVAHVAYVPFQGGDNPMIDSETGKPAHKGVVGLSKLARLVDAYARRLQVQERMTEEIARTLFEATGKHGVAVIIEAKHNCMRCRGIKQRNATMVTSKMLGCFYNKPEARAEVMSLLLRGV